MKIYKISYLLIVASLVYVMLPALVSANSSYFNVFLSKSSSQKNEVIKLQEFLNNQGILNGKIDGIFGLGTSKAVMAFQTNYGLKADGRFGPITQSKANMVYEGGLASKVSSGISLKSIEKSSLLGASALSSNSLLKIIWEASSYPKDAGVDINLIRKIEGPVTSYEFIRKIAVDTLNDGREDWAPQKGEAGSDMYIEVTCSSTYNFSGSCQIAGAPMKVQ